MITIETAATSLDFAYCSVKRLPAYHIYLLQDVALQHGAHGTTGDTNKAFALLDEVRRDQQKRLRHYEKLLIYPRMATDYHVLGRHDIALDIIVETIQKSKSLLRRWEASVLAYVADVCIDIGERDLCEWLVRNVTKYIDTQSHFRTSIRENYWVYDLFTLYLHLEMVHAAEILAAKMVGSQRVDALATLAFHGQPDGQCNEFLLATIMERSGAYTKALVASLMIRSGQFSRATVLLDQISQTYIRDEPLLEMVKCMLQRNDSSGALDLLERLLATPNAISVDSEHLVPICAMLHDNHGEMLNRVLGCVSSAAQASKSRCVHLEDMTALVGVLASFSPDRAEEAADQLFDACMAEIERGKNNVSDMSLKTVPVALHTVAIDIDKYGLSWTDRRREMFRQILGRIPVPRRFEYADFFKAKVVL